MAFTRRETAILLIGDFFILAASLWVALILRNLELPAPSYFGTLLVPFIPIFLISLGVFYIAGLYEKQTRVVRRVMSERIAGAQVANVVIAALIFFLSSLSIAPKTILALYLFVSVMGVSAWRFWRASREIAGSSRIKGLLVARGDSAKELYEEVEGSARHLMRFVEHIDTATVHVTGELAERVARALKEGVRIVVLDTRDPVVEKDLPQLYAAMIEGVSFLEFSAFYEEAFDRVPIEHIDHAWLLERLPRQHTVYDVLKRTFDIVLSAIGLVIAAPFVFVAAILLWLTGGPAFIYNERVGRSGRVFKLVKLRTMLYNDRGDETLRAKNRVTRLGKFLRKSRIDELPQLWNILVGDVSFIGPRPELPALVAVYDAEIPYYQARHLIPPGLSGWAQIRDYDAPKGGADVNRTKVKLSYDLYYLKHRSFGLDLSIALKTIRALASFSGK